MPDHPHQNQALETAGAPLESADSAMILIHGRGASAKSILELSRVFSRPGMLYVAPQAANNTWYPYRFIAPIVQNEPFLSSGLAVIGDQVRQLVDGGIPTHRIILGGFSQGACIACEYVARNPAKYGGVFVFSGGLIGPPDQLPAYSGSLERTPVFIGCSDHDAHIPLTRVHETEYVLHELGARVTKKIYPGTDHSINADEIKEARLILEEMPAV